jgi:NCAIR mutase (PurE)-related protein
MTSAELQDLLHLVRHGTLDPSSAAAKILTAMRAAPFEDLGFARLDTHREVRQGFPEVVLGLGKTPAQVATIAEKIVARGQTLLVTRAQPDVYDAVRVRVPGATYHPDARAITLAQGRVEVGQGTILIVCAGTSDLSVAEEAAITAALMGNRIDRVYDVGVAGLHRLLAEHDRIQSARVLIVVAGMEGALPSVVAGLVKRPVIAVPTSVGYGVASGGHTALHGMLASCASGITVMNIDNGCGAAMAAVRILRQLRRGGP